VTKANEYMALAEKKLKGNFLSNFMSGGTRFEEAAELYNRAGNLYKLAKSYDQGGGAYMKAANVYLKESPFEAAGALVNAAACYKKSSIPEAVNCLKQAVELYVDSNKYNMAAKHQKEIAELYEGEMNYEEALGNYQIAADYYDAENSPAAAKGCLLKVATYAADLEDYSKAIEIFEQMGKKGVDEKLGKWGAKDFFFKAGICKLAAGDFVSLKQSLEVYKDLLPTFSHERECKLLEDLLTACEKCDAEAFTNALAEFDSITPLDKWKTSIFSKVKQSIKEEDILV